jgi:carbon-monoxide dehydrogenase large subunit
VATSETLATTPGKWVGKSIRRKEDLRFLTGRGQYADDVEPKGTLHLAMLRSPHAHAMIRRIDTSRAKDLPGVAAVLTGAEALAYTGPLAVTINLGLKVPTVFAIATDKVRYVGEPVAVVAAVDRYVAEDALDLIDVDYEPLPAVVTIEDALAPKALLYEEWESNVQLDWQMTVGDMDAAFASATDVFEETFTHSRYTGTPLEGRVCLADYNPATGRMTVTLSTQAASQVRTLLAQTLGMAEEQIRVIALDVGGGFGTKLQANVEVIPCIVSRMLGRPVKWTEDRIEHMLTGIQTRDYVATVKLGLDAAHRITALSVRLVGNIGVDGSCHAAGTPTLQVACGYFPGPYKVPAYHAETVGVVTNKGPYGAYRGYGKDIANFPIERMMDHVAGKLGLAPEELRRINFIGKDEYPYQQVSGPLYDSGDYATLMDMALEQIGYQDFRARQAELRAQGRYIGVGIAAMLEPSGAAVPNGIFNGYQPATIRLMAEGGIQVLTSHQSIGQGIETTLAQVVAETMDVDIDNVRILYGDTDVVPYGLGPFSSRGATYVVSAVHEASKLLREKILAIAGNMLEVAPSDLEVDSGRVQVKGSPEKALTFKQIANAALLWPGPYVIVPEGVDPNLEATYTWMGPKVRWVPDENGTIALYTTHPTGVFIATVEVDVETGRVEVDRFVVAHDCGTIINPMIAEGQVQGGVAQGIGGALLEELRYDEDGQLLNADFSTYLVPTMMEIPDIEVSHLVSPSPFTPLGTKGMGEGGAIPSPAAVVNAVEDALSPFGAVITSLPLGSESVLEAIRAGQRHGA